MFEAYSFVGSIVQGNAARRIMSRQHLETLRGTLAA
jgi:hypothetical protein